MTIAVGNILRVVCTIAALDGNVIQNVFNAIVTGSGGPFQESDIADDLNDWMDNVFGNMSAHIAADFDPSESTSYVYDPTDNDWDEIGSASPTFTTTNVNNALPRGVAMLINAKTSDPDVNGKKYVGGLTEGGWDGLDWNAGLVTAMGLFGFDWFTPFVGSASGATMTPAIWSPTRTAAYVLSGTFVIPTMASYQRRRKPGVGS